MRQNDQDHLEVKKLKEKIENSEDSLLLTLISKELSKFNVDIDKEAARDFVSFNLKVKFLGSIIASYVGSFVFFSIGIIFLYSLISNILTGTNQIPLMGSFVSPVSRFQDERFLHEEEPLSIFSLIFTVFPFILALAFTLSGVYLFIYARKLHKVFKASKKGNKK